MMISFLYFLLGWKWLISLSIIILCLLLITVSGILF
jgi:hypothetical protein